MKEAEKGAILLSLIVHNRPSRSPFKLRLEISKTQAYFPDEKIVQFSGHLLNVNYLFQIIYMRRARCRL